MGEVHLLLAIVVVIAGCGSADPIASSGEEPQRASAAPTVQEPVATDNPCLEHAYDEEACLAKMNADEASQPPGVSGELETEGDGTYVADYEYAIDGASWKHEGFRFRVVKLALTDHDEFCSTFDEFDEPTICYNDYDDGGTIVAMDLRVVNNSGRDVDFYADQAEVVLGSEQIDMNNMLGPDPVGGTFREGTKRNGQAWWLSEQSVDEVDALGEMRMIVGAPVWTDDYEPISGDYDNIDMTITW